MWQDGERILNKTTEMPLILIETVSEMQLSRKNLRVGLRVTFLSK